MNRLSKTFRLASIELCRRNEMLPPICKTEAQTRGLHWRKCAEAWEVVQDSRDRKHQHARP